MGAADIVPGVSGGTIALITGIYERLLGAIVAVDGEALSMALAGPPTPWRAPHRPPPQLLRATARRCR